MRWYVTYGSDGLNVKRVHSPYWVNLLLTRPKEKPAFALRYVERRGDAYVPLMQAIQFEKPFYVEARFDTAPQAQSYDVTLDTGFITRTVTVHAVDSGDKQAAFRSDAIVLRQCQWQTQSGAGQ